MEPNTNTPQNETPSNQPYQPSDPSAPLINAPSAAPGPFVMPDDATPAVGTAGANASFGHSDQVGGPASPIVRPTYSPAQAPVVGDMDPASGVSRSDYVASQSIMGVQSAVRPGRKFPKAALLGLAAILVLGVAGASYYFGYYMKPSVVYAQSLANTGKGYDKLVSYVQDQAKASSKGYEGTGTYKVVSTDNTTDGKLSFKGDGENSVTNFDVGLGVTRVAVELRTLKSASTNPDIYLKASGITGLGALTGSPEFGASIDALDNKWIVIDHTLLDNLQQQATQTSAAMVPPTQEQVMDELTAFGKVNQQYIFSTDKSRAVTTVIKTYGKETIDGHKTVHYKVGFVKANVKKYITAQRDALNASKLGDWIKKNKYEDQVKSGYDSLVKSADSISSKDTIDVWADMQNRIIYKVRVSDKTNPAANYVDLGLDYKKNGVYPFFLSAQSKEGTTAGNGSVIATLNSKDNSLTLKVLFKQSGEMGSNFDGTFNYKPSNTTVKVEVPSGAQPLSQVLDTLGLGDFLSATSLSGSNDSAADTKRKVDVQSIRAQLEAYYAQNGYYPSLAQLNSPSWRSSELTGFDDTALKDPEGSAAVLSAAPAARTYSYQTKTLGGGSCDGLASTTCDTYSLSATLSDGSLFAKDSLN